MYSFDLCTLALTSPITVEFNSSNPLRHVSSSVIAALIHVCMLLIWKGVRDMVRADRAARSLRFAIRDLGSEDTLVNSSMATRRETLRKCSGSGLGGAGKGDMEARQESGCRVTAHTAASRSAVELEETGGDDVEGERDGFESPPRSEWEWFRASLSNGEMEWKLGEIRRS
nr:hypothetical protein Iba_chr03aCG9020 [Ipomoea batatas]